MSLSLREATMPVDPEREFGGRGKGFRFQRAGAAFLLATTLDQALQNRGLGVVRELTRLERPFRIAQRGPRGCGLFPGGIEKLRGKFLRPGKEFGWWRCATLAEAVGEGGEEREWSGGVWED